MERCFKTTPKIQKPSFGTSKKWAVLPFFGKTNGGSNLLSRASLKYSLLQKKNNLVSVNKAFNQETFIELFNLPLSQTAHRQMLNLQQIVEATILQDCNDVWTQTGNATGFSSSKIYWHLNEHPPTEPVFKWIWESFVNQSTKCSAGSF